MSFITSAEGAVLRCVKDGASYGQDIVRASRGVKVGSVYCMLKRLVDKGCVTVESQPGLAPRIAHSYRITRNGRILLRAWAAGEAAYQAEMEKAMTEEPQNEGEN